MRRILKIDPTHLVAPLAMLRGIDQALDRAALRNAGDQLPLPAILGIAVVFGPLGGLLGLYIAGWLLSWSGRKLGGVADQEFVRAAVAWSQAPVVASLVIWSVQLAAVGREMFTTATPTLDANPSLAMLLLATGGAEIVLGVWSFILLLKCLGEAHRFSAWRALGALLLAVLAVLGVLIAVIAIVLIPLMLLKQSG